MADCSVSVVIPCHNYGQYLNDAVESVLQQKDVTNTVEVVVINDHSSDANTLQKLSYWKKADCRVRVVDNPGRLGAATARNLGISVASEEWIAFLDADDVWTAEALQARWQVIQTYPEAQWLGADFVHWREDGTYAAEGFFQGRSLAHPSLTQAYESGTAVKLVTPARDFLRMSLAWTSTVMAKKSLLLSVGGFATNLGNYEDHHLWIRLARIADFFFLPQVVVLYRQHALSVSRREGPPAYWFIVAMHLLLQDPSFRLYQPLIRHKLASLFLQNVYYHRGRGEMRLAAVAALRAIGHGPS